MQGLFVTGTDTGVGKTVVAASIVATLRARGEAVRAFKPVVTGTDEPDPDWPADHELLAASAGMDPTDVTPVLFGPAVSPHLAAELAGTPIEPAKLLAHARSLGEPLIVEGVGGLLVPITSGYAIRDLARDLGLPLVVVARPGLGTINHTLLTIEAARAVGLEVRCVVLSPWPHDPSAMEHSNRHTIERLGGVPVHGLPPVTPASLPTDLAWV
ncbi:MAG: dethiobiotin synthetase [Solirubrobacteraceae bacterium]|nr:dethiobiotin synthetase [Solirubrobacteraceae bacterium]